MPVSIKNFEMSMTISNLKIRLLTPNFEGIRFCFETTQAIDRIRRNSKASRYFPCVEGVGRQKANSSAIFASWQRVSRADAKKL
jgi:hypothetical protein